jgi:LPS O-antigen subunit length determinant protein (WzzB/FepE family)
MAATFTDAAMQDAAAALQTSQAYRAGRGEQLLNKIGVAPRPPIRRNPEFIPTGDRTLAVSGSQAVSAAKGVMATAAFSVVKDQITSFAENSKTLMKVLDEVGKVHPFIQSMSHPISPMGPDRTFILILQLL